jgi:hypothetical protein
MILTSEELGADRRTNIENLLKSQACRSHLARNIYQEKFDEGKHQILTDKSFDDLHHIIFNTFLLCNSNQAHYEDIRLLTKACFHYKHQPKGHKNYQFLYQELIKKGTFSVWSDYEFWLMWFEDDLESRPNTLPKVEDHYFSLLLHISNIMRDLNIDLVTILYFIIDKIGHAYIKDCYLLNDLRTAIVKQSNHKNNH